MKTLFAAAAVFLLLATAARAAGPEEIWKSQSEALDIEGVERAAGEYMEDTELKADISLDEGLRRILGRGEEAFTGVLRRAVGSGVLLIAVVLLCGAAANFYEWSGTGMNTAMIVGALGVTAVAVGDIHALAGMGSEAIANLDVFSKSLLPVLAAAAAAAGNITGASARQLATMLFSDLFLTVISRLLLPLVYAYAATCLAFAATGNRGLKKVASFLKWAAGATLSLLMAVYVGYLTLSGAITGTVDASLMKAAKFTISGVVPVIGGILSDATEAILAGAGILKNAVGIFGLLTVLSICAAPFLELGVHYLVYKLSSALASTVADGPTADLIGEIGDAFGLILGMTGACALLLLVSIVSAVSVMGP